MASEGLKLQDNLGSICFWLLTTKTAARSHRNLIEHRYPLWKSKPNQKLARWRLVVFPGSKLEGEIHNKSMKHELKNKTSLQAALTTPCFHVCLYTDSKHVWNAGCLSSTPGVNFDPMILCSFLWRIRWTTLESHSSKQIMVYKQITFFIKKSNFSKLDFMMKMGSRTRPDRSRPRKTRKTDRKTKKIQEKIGKKTLTFTKKASQSCFLSFEEGGWRSAHSCPRPWSRRCGRVP